MRSCLVLPLAAASAILLASCGDSGADVSGSPAGSDAESAAERIEAVAERFERIVAEKDTQAFCQVLAPSDVRRLGGGETNGERECLTVWGPARNPLFRAQEADFEIDSVSFEGSYATAELANGGELAFAQEGGEWYVHLAPGPGQGARR